MCLESLENRALLAGVVDVVVAGGALTLTGDGSNNQVDIQRTNTPGEFRISSPDDTLFTLNGVNPPTLPEVTVNGIVNNISSDLLDGNDQFRVLGISPGVITTVPQHLLIFNSDGSNVNEIIDTLINGDLIVNKAGSGYSELLVQDSTVNGQTNVNNFGNGFGDTKTVIDNSSLREHFLLNNPDGQNITDVLANSQFGRGNFIAAQPIIHINNAGGGSRTTFSGSSQVAGPGTTTVYGGIELFNGFNVQGTLNVFTLNSVNVLGYIDVVNDDGNTQTMVLDTTTGSQSTDPTGGPLTIQNAEGFDSFELKDSKLPWGLYIDNDYQNEGQSNWGSNTNINNSMIGHLLNPISDTAVQIYGDDGPDTVVVSDSMVFAILSLVLYHGENVATLQNNPTIAGFEYSGGDGKDVVTIDDSTILYRVEIALFDGDDELTLMNMDYATQWPNPLLDFVAIDGGFGTDTLFGQIPPTNVYNSIEVNIP